MSAKAGDAGAIRRTYAAKARAEIALADGLLPGRVRVDGSGDPAARILLVKGVPGPEDLAAGRALAGPDGDAASKAIQALGHDPGSVWATCSRPLKADAELIARRLELTIEAVDPAVVLALDGQAASDVARATCADGLPPGRPAHVRGRVVGAVDGLADSLSDQRAKARVWHQMQAVFAALDEKDQAPGKTTGRPKAPREHRDGRERA